MSVDLIHALMAVSFLTVLAMVGQIIMRPPREFPDEE